MLTAIVSVSCQQLRQSPTNHARLEAGLKGPRNAAATVVDTGERRLDIAATALTVLRAN